ncbi:hypothetical protein AAG906_010476 [Vitis piasezkii]
MNFFRIPIFPLLSRTESTTCATQLDANKREESAVCQPKAAAAEQQAGGGGTKQHGRGGEAAADSGAGRERKEQEDRGGGWRTAAECAAICCCCPCGVMNLLILAVYKLPAGLCRKMWRRRNLRRKKRNALLQQRPSAGPPTCSCDEGNVQMIERGGKNGVDLDDEMWARFYGAGFWRSSSQREA